jgi:hypothetical protein
LALNIFKKQDSEEIHIDDSELNDFLYTKKQKLLNLFNTVPTNHPLKYVLEFTGIKNQTTLKAMLTRLRKKGIDIKIKFDWVKRVK